MLKASLLLYWSEYARQRLGHKESVYPYRGYCGRRQRIVGSVVSWTRNRPFYLILFNLIFRLGWFGKRDL